jgi:hypothetical protein
MSTVWRIAESVAWLGDEQRVALLDVAAGGELPVVLTDSSAAIWSTIDTLADEEALVAHVAGLFEVSADEIREQVRGFLEDLCLRRLIVRA